MQLDNDEYRVKELDGLQTITITKEALEKWRDHYFEVATNMERFPIDQWQQKYYLGKHAVLVDLLKHFEELEG